MKTPNGLDSFRLTLGDPDSDVNPDDDELDDDNPEDDDDADVEESDAMRTSRAGR